MRRAGGRRGQTEPLGMVTVRKWEVSSSQEPCREPLAPSIAPLRPEGALPRLPRPRKEAETRGAAPKMRLALTARPPPAWRQPRRPLPCGHPVQPPHLASPHILTTVTAGAGVARDAANTSREAAAASMRAGRARVRRRRPAAAAAAPCTRERGGPLRPAASKLGLHAAAAGAYTRLGYLRAGKGHTTQHAGRRGGPAQRVQRTTPPILHSQQPTLALQLLRCKPPQTECGPTQPPPPRAAAPPSRRPQPAAPPLTA